MKISVPNMNGDLARGEIDDGKYVFFVKIISSDFEKTKLSKLLIRTIDQETKEYKIVLNYDINSGWIVEPDDYGKEMYKRILKFFSLSDD